MTDLPGLSKNGRYAIIRPLPWSGIEVVITGLTRNQFVGLPARGKGAECQHSVLSGEAGNEASLLARKGE